MRFDAHDPVAFDSKKTRSLRTHDVKPGCSVHHGEIIADRCEELVGSATTAGPAVAVIDNNDDARRQHPSTKTYPYDSAPLKSAAEPASIVPNRLSSRLLPCPGAATCEKTS
jgi:hypothetical protein